MEPVSSTNGIVAGIAAAFLGLFRWLMGRQIARIDDLEAWRLEMRELQGEFACMKKDVAEVKGKVDAIYNMLAKVES